MRHFSSPSSLSWRFLFTSSSRSSILHNVEEEEEEGVCSSYLFISLPPFLLLPSSPRFVSDPETDNRSVRSRLHFWGKVFASSLPSRSLPFSASHACTLCKCSRRSEGTGKKEGIANFRASNIQCRFDARRQRRSPCLDSDPLLRMRSNDESEPNPRNYCIH